MPQAVAQGARIRGQAGGEAVAFSGRVQEQIRVQPAVVIVRFIQYDLVTGKLDVAACFPKCDPYQRMEPEECAQEGKKYAGIRVVSLQVVQLVAEDQPSSCSL